MTKLKRLCIDWFWPDQTTFLINGRRYAKLHFWVAALLLVFGLVAGAGFHYFFSREIDPWMTAMADELESASESQQVVPPRTLKAAAGTVQAFQQLLRDLLLYFPILSFAVSAMVLYAGVNWLRAHQALAYAIQAGPQDRPRRDS